MASLIIESIRCFGGRHEIPIRPLTVLVGENSSGKSTLLAAARIAWDLARDEGGVDFNEEPFLLGTFEQIATATETRTSGGDRSFSLGWNFTASPGSPIRRFAEEVQVLGTFEKIDSQPRLVEWSARSGDLRLAMRRRRDDEGPQTHQESQSRFEIPGKPPRMLHVVGPVRSALRWDALWASELTFGHVGTSDAEAREELGLFHELLKPLEVALGERPFAFSPIRTHPRRSYDPVQGIPSSEGAHVPMLLSRIFARGNSEWKELGEAIAQFGRSSGLFEKVEIRHLGDHDSDPFQVQVKIAGAPFNLIDVGYGVSQILPILVDCLRSDERQTFLLQQPEVHLHPRAQAELGSFLATAVKARSKHFLVETHSDHLVDRIRLDVRDGRYPREDFVILFCERDENGARVHPITVDEHGNLVGAPPGYRQFFLEEDRRLLGV